MIKTVCKLMNGGVMVFDGGGRQMTKYQGFYEEVKGLVLSKAPDKTMFLKEVAPGKLDQVSRENW